MMKNGPPEMKLKSIYKQMFATFPKFNFVVEENLITISSLSHHYMKLHAARLLIGLFFGKPPTSCNVPYTSRRLKRLKKPMGFYPMGNPNEFRLATAFRQPPLVGSQREAWLHEVL